MPLWITGTAFLFVTSKNAHRILKLRSEDTDRPLPALRALVSESFPGVADIYCALWGTFLSKKIAVLQAIKNWHKQKEFASESGVLKRANDAPPLDIRGSSPIWHDAPASDVTNDG